MEYVDQNAVVCKNQIDNLTGQPCPSETDLPPEFCSYRDEGCELAPSCLNCPLPRCVEDLPNGRVAFAKLLRNHEICRLHVVEKKSVKELMAQFKLSRRSIMAAISSERSQPE
jgi:hypothetical protein